GAAVQRVEAVGVDVVGRLARAADAREHGHAVGRDLELRQRALNRGQDAEVAAAGAPVVVDVGLVVLQREPRVDCHAFSPWAAPRGTEGAVCRAPATRAGSYADRCVIATRPAPLPNASRGPFTISPF